MTPVLLTERETTVNRRLLAALALGLAGCASASGKPAPAAQPRPATGGAASPATPASGTAAAPGAAARSGLKPFAELTKDATHRAGFFDTYEKGDALYLVVPKEQLGKDFLLTFQLAQGVGAAGLYSGTMLDIFEGAVVAFERHGDRVFLVRKPTRFTAPAGSAVATAVENAFGASVLASAKVESQRADSALAINVYDWVVSDLSGIGEYVKYATAPRPGQPGAAMFDKERSHLVSVKAFPKNLNLRARLTFRPQQPVGFNSVPDGRFLPLTVAYVFAALPEVPMTPREADDRLGYFITARKDFSRDGENSFFVRYVNRWRLEPSGQTVDGLMVPKQPIVYYIDRNVPEAYRPYLKAGVEEWARAFEAAGWKHAIRAEMLPDSADAEDIRYATLRWGTSDQPGYGAIGPSIVDPRTGEILDADIIFEAQMVRGYKRDWRTTVSPAAAVEQVFAPQDVRSDHGLIASELSAQGTLLSALLAARGEIAPGDAVPMEYVGQALKWVTMHEMGHTLGLRHNFRASAETPLEKLHDRGWAEQRGLYNSVMEYPALNVAPRGASAVTGPGGYAYNPSVGPYDVWVIAYGYTHDAARAQALAREGAAAGHAYGTDEDANGPGALDPTVAVFDLSSDPLAWGRQRAELLSGLWATLPQHVLADNSRYADLTDVFQTLLGQYARALVPAVKYIGGQYQYRDRVGDPQGRAPFVAVPRAKQREALTFLAEYGFGEDAFRVPRPVLQQMGANRWSHWGETNSYEGRIDYPLHEQVLGVQTALLRQLTSPLVFARIRDAELKYGSAAVLPIPELMSELTRAVWSELYRGDGGIPAQRRDLQRAYLDRMTTILTTPEPRTPADARSVARYTLRTLDGRLGQALAGGGLDTYSRAHLLEARARIGKALEAGLEAEK